MDDYEVLSRSSLPYKSLAINLKFEHGGNTKGPVNMKMKVPGLLVLVLRCSCWGLSAVMCAHRSALTFSFHSPLLPHTLPLWPHFFLFLNHSGWQLHRRPHQIPTLCLSNQSSVTLISLWWCNEKMHVWMCGCVVVCGTGDGSVMHTIYIPGDWILN